MDFGAQPIPVSQTVAAPGPLAVDEVPQPKTSSLWPTIAAVLAALVAAAWAAAQRFPTEGKRLKAAAARLALKGVLAGEALARRLNSLTTRTAPSGGVRGAIADIKAANAATSAGLLLADVEKLITGIRQAGPLSDVLTGELGQLRQRLSGLQASASESDEAAQRAAPGFRNLIRDIERVRRIADSAALSMGAGQNTARIPATRAEAFALLGLNPDVAEGTLKKVADGLRMNWHPDHARDADDRTAREARIKAINAALEIINGKRAA